MNKEIRYNGFSVTPSDYDAPDGDIAGAISLVQEDGALRPTLPPKRLFTMPEEYKIEFIHNNSTYKHYIIRKGNTLYWFDSTIIADVAQQPFDITEKHITELHTYSGELHEINAVGNTLIAFTSENMHYLLWNNDTKNYSYLGTHIPELPISFGLQGKRAESDSSFDISFNQNVSSVDKIIGTFQNEDLKNSVTEQALAKVNKFIADHYTDGNEFIYSFFVRYAYRLYDGTLSMHSAPILMVCGTGEMPYLLGSGYRLVDDGYDGSWDEQYLRNCKVYCALYKLDMAIVSQSYINNLKKWSDIVSSVDIFVSAPLYSYDQSGKCSGASYLSFNSNDYCICRATHGGIGFSDRYQTHQMTAFFFYGKNSLPGIKINLPMKNMSERMESIKSCSLFYFLKSYSLESLKTGRQIVDVPNGYFKSLVNREVMTDDYDSHATIRAKRSFVYNSRLNLADITLKPFEGYHAAAQFCWTDGYVQAKNGKLSQGPDYTYDKLKDVISVFIYIKKNGKTFIVCGDGMEFGVYNKLPYIFYPDNNAYKAVVLRVNPFNVFYNYFEVNLTQHPTLNGALYFNNWEEPTKRVNVNLLFDPSVNKGIIDLPNKLYTSEINNPFLFPALGINTVGTGTILAISTAAKALSQGQFGQFPLYAFTTEGIWALEVSSEGKFTARQPITRDVCINTESVTQIDTAVLYATNRGIMLISGSDSICISDILNSKTVFSIDSLPNLRTVVGADKAAIMEYAPFMDFIKESSMLYDYTHQRIIVYNPSQPYAYLYSMKSKMWSLIQSDIQMSLNSYPEALVTLAAKNGRYAIADYSHEDETTQEIDSILVTRPLKLDAPDILKTVNAIIQRGYFKTGHVKTILYGSRDLLNWHLVSSSSTHRINNISGTPYKYFRIVLLCDFEKNESVSGCSLTYKQRFTNKLR